MPVRGWPLRSATHNLDPLNFGMRPGPITERIKPSDNAAKARGVYKGRKPGIKADEVRRPRKEGLGATEIAKKLRVGRASVYRVLTRLPAMWPFPIGSEVSAAEVNRAPD